MSLPFWVFGRQMKWHGRLHVLPIECKGDFPGTHLAHKWDSDAAYALPLLHTLFFEPLFHWLQTVFIPFAASFIYMNGDKPRSEYYHLRSICCYTTDFELNLQNEKNKYKPTVFAFITRALCRRKVRKDETDLFPVKSRRFTWKQKTKIQRTMRLHHRTIWPWCCSCSKDMGCQIRNQLFNIRGFRVICGLSFFHGGHG